MHVEDRVLQLEGDVASMREKVSQLEGDLRGMTDWLACHSVTALPAPDTSADPAHVATVTLDVHVDMELWCRAQYTNGARDLSDRSLMDELSRVAHNVVGKAGRGIMATTGGPTYQATHAALSAAVTLLRALGDDEPCSVVGSMCQEHRYELNPNGACPIAAAREFVARHPEAGVTQ